MSSFFLILFGLWISFAEAATPLQYGIGLNATSTSVYRGALLTKDPYFMPGLSIKYGEFVFAGVNFMYSINDEKAQWGFSANYFSDHMFKTVDQNDFRRQRPETWEAGTSFSYQCSEGFKSKLGFQQDLRAHGGQFFSLSGEQKLPLHLKLTALIGYGSPGQNEYVYGPGSRPGWTHAEGSISYSDLVLPWKGFFSLGATLSHILQEENRRAGFVDEDPDPIVFSIGGRWVL